MHNLSKQQLYEILERINDGIAALDKNWCYICINRSGAEMLGKKPEDLIGKHIWTEFPEGIGQPFYNAYYMAMEEQRPIQIEAYYSPWDRWFENRIYPSADGITILFHDITNKKKAEESYFKEKVFSDTVINSLPGIFYMFNEEGKFQRWNENFEIISGYSSEEIAGMRPTDFFTGEDKELIASRINEVFSTGKASVEAKFISRDGKATPFLFTGQCLQIEKRKFLIGMGIDITEQITLSIENAKLYKDIVNYSEKLEEKVSERTAELERANIRLKELDRLKSIFVATMSHELRTPLNSIIGFTGIILQGLTGDITSEQRKQLSIVKKSANHLLDLINDVIDISKIEADRVEIYPTEIDISGLLNEVIASFSNEVEERGLSLDIRMPEKLIIRTDQKRVRQVLNNLLSNAVKFTFKGGINIEVVEGDGDIRIYVRDTGIGIKTGDMGKLFKAFSKIQHEHTPVIEGTGLGLYLSYKIAHLLGGKLSVESEFGNGSTFTFILPKGAVQI